MNTFPAIDSFEIISNGADVFKEIFGQIDDKYGLVCFQMTISDHYPISSIGLKTISEAFKELCNTEGDIPIAFVFVLLKNKNFDAFKAQQIHTSKNTVLRNQQAYTRNLRQFKVGIKSEVLSELQYLKT